MDNKAVLPILNEEFKHNFKDFSTQLLGYKDIGIFHLESLKNIAEIRRLENIPSRRLWLWARGHFKTSLITEAHSVWLIVNNPNIRLLIVSNTLDIAKKILSNIKSHFIFNQSFRKIYPDFCPLASDEGKIEFGTTEYFTVPNRTKALKEPTAMCAGVGTNLTGLHFDYMKIDDLVTKDSVSNDTQIQASKDYYASLRQLFDNPTIPREDVIGTIYHFNDLHRDLQKNADFKQSFIPVASDMSFEDRVFPERFSKEGVQAILNDPSVGPYIFASQYMLNPINPADAKFREEWFKCYDKYPNGLAEYICVDPASTVKKKSDYTVLERWGVDHEGFHYLLEGVRDKLTTFQRIERLFSMVEHSNNLKYVKYEVLGGRHGDIETIKEQMRLKRKYFSIRETKSTNASKIDRIEQRLVGAWHAGVIRVPYSLAYRSLYDGKAHDFIQEYKMEFLQFPFTEHDDILDCHSQMFEETLIKGKKESTPEKDDEFEWWRQQAINKNKPDRSKFVFGNKGKFLGIPAKESWI